MAPTTVRALAVALLLALLPPTARAQPAASDHALEGPIATALLSLDGDVRVYNDHVVILASPFMEGRLPGTRGMGIASEYVEHGFRQAGLRPPFDDGQGGMTHRQAFPLAATPEIVSQHIEPATGELPLRADEDFRALGLGGSGDVTGELAFVGYSIDAGPDGYSSFREDDDLSGKVALMLRFEPMDEAGKSRWSTRGPWTGRAGLPSKFRAVQQRNPAAVVLVNTPGADDPRVGQLLSVSGGGGQVLDAPVVMLSTEAAEQLLGAVDPASPTLLELREIADAMGGTIPLGGDVRVAVELVREPVMAENVGGLLPGRGALADELIVIGAHLDHLGMGDFGSRSGPGELHPGADDNASGSAAVMMLADKLAADYAALPEGAEARSILFLCFSAEESGLNGARFYVEHPIVPIEQHALMVNFDMIGRITGRRLSVSGTGSAEGLAAWLLPWFETSGLEVVTPATMSGASDHSAFYGKQVPVLFGIIADFHDDYHTPRDVSWKLNRVDAVATVHLFHDIALAAATRPEPFVFQSQAAGAGAAFLSAVGQARRQEQPDYANTKVRFGINPGAGAGTGVLVGTVSPGSSAAEAGLLAGDRLVSWNGLPIESVLAWMGTLTGHEPGDEVEVGVQRGDERLNLRVTLKARDG